jgi:TRAP-type uncharacterized transport system substrate-binding protein
MTTARWNYLAYGEAIEQMKNGQCDVAFVTPGLGNATQQGTGRTTKEIVFIPGGGTGASNLITKYPFFIESVIAGGEPTAPRPIPPPPPS